MAGLAEVFFDTSVLVAGTVNFGPRSRAPFRLLDAVAEGEIEGPTTAWHCCLELYSVITRLPKEYRVSPKDADRILREEVLARFLVRALPPDARGSLLALAGAESIAGGRLYDLHIAEIARRTGAKKVVTENRRHFTSLLAHGIPVLSSEELAVELDAEESEAAGPEG